MGEKFNLNNYKIKSIIYKRKEYSTVGVDLPSRAEGIYVYDHRRRVIVLNNNLNENEKELALKKILNKVDRENRKDIFIF